MGVLTGERTAHRYQTCQDEDCEPFSVPRLQERAS